MEIASASLLSWLSLLIALPAVVSSPSPAVAAGAAAAAGGLTSPLQAASAPTAADFASNWKACPDRVWLGPEYWSNPLQDWSIGGGRIECTNAAPDRNVHLLVRTLGAKRESFTIDVRIGRADGATLAAGKGSLGFRIGTKGSLPDFRNSLIFGRGLDAGVTAEGGLFIGNPTTARPAAGRLGVSEAELRLTGVPAASGYALTLTLLDAGGAELAKVTREAMAEQCVGGLVLVNNFPGPGGARGAAKGKAGKAAAAAGGADPAGVGRFWRSARTAKLTRPYVSGPKYCSVPRSAGVGS